MARSWLAGLMVVLAACSGGDDKVGETNTITRTLGPAGGSLQLLDGARVEIPAGALSQSVTIRITKLDLDDVAALPSHLEPAGKPYAFEPFDLELLEPVKIDLPVEDLQAQTRPMKLPRKDSETREWITVFPSERDGAKLQMEVASLGVLLAATPTRNSGVITLPDGAVIPEDAGVSDAGDAAIDASEMADATGPSADAGDAAGVDVPWVWLDQFGSDMSCSVSGVTLGSADSVFLAGTVYGVFPGQTSDGYEDAFVRKLNDDGVEQWVRQVGTDGTDYADDVAVKSTGELYVAGTTSGTFAGQTKTGSWDAFVTKLDASGVVVWTRQLGTTGNNSAGGVAVDGDGNVFVGGAVGANGAFAGQTNAGNIDAFVRKYDADGNELWTRQFGSTAADYVYAVGVDGAGNVFVAGTTGGTLPGQTSFGGDDAYVRKYDGNGSVLWTRQFGDTNYDYAFGLAVDASGNCAVAGTMPAGEFNGDSFVRKYDASGTELWTHRADLDDENSALGVAIDAQGAVAIGGQTRARLPGQTQLGYRDAYVRKLNAASGAEVWTHQFGGGDQDGEGGGDEASDVAFNAAGEVIAVGKARGIYPGATPTGSQDAFVAKFAN